LVALHLEKGRRKLLFLSFVSGKRAREEPSAGEGKKRKRVGGEFAFGGGVRRERFRAVPARGERGKQQMRGEGKMKVFLLTGGKREGKKITRFTIAVEKGGKGYRKFTGERLWETV